MTDGTLAGSVTTRSVPVVAPISATGERAPSTAGRSLPRIARRPGSSTSSTHRPSAAMPTGTTSYASRSIAASTLPAVTHEMPCSEERPPKTTATRGLRPVLGEEVSFIGTTLSTYAG